MEQLESQTKQKITDEQTYTRYGYKTGPFVPQFTPVLAQKTHKRYKYRYMLYKKLSIGLFCLLTLVSIVLGWALRGNNTLMNELAKKDINIIMPNKSIAHSK